MAALAFGYAIQVAVQMLALPTACSLGLQVSNIDIHLILGATFENPLGASGCFELEVGFLLALLNKRAGKSVSDLTTS